MNNNIKTFPNQKVVKIQKEQCNSKNYYATINLNAMEKAALDLQAGAFKLWCYFAKNKNEYSFALSSKAAEENFGIKIKQYNKAVEELKEKGYLVNTKGNEYLFLELPNSLIPFGNNEVIPKKDNTLLPKEIRNNTESIYNNTKDFIF